MADRDRSIAGLTASLSEARAAASAALRSSGAGDSRAVPSSPSSPASGGGAGSAKIRAAEIDALNASLDRAHKELDVARAQVCIFFCFCFFFLFVFFLCCCGLLLWVVVVGMKRRWSGSHTPPPILHPPSHACVCHSANHLRLKTRCVCCVDCVA